jgi:hypothetical protein
MIHFISSRDSIGSLILTSLTLHRCVGQSAPSLTQASLSHTSLASKPPTCPSHLQPVHRAKPHLDLLQLGHMTQCHVSRAISSSIITCASFATFPSHFHLHGICCSHTCTCGLITYVSHINTISPPKLSLNYQNRTRTFHNPPCPLIHPARMRIAPSSCPYDSLAILPVHFDSTRPYPRPLPPSFRPAPAGALCPVMPRSLAPSMPHTTCHVRRLPAHSVPFPSPRVVPPSLPCVA